MGMIPDDDERLPPLEGPLAHLLAVVDLGLRRREG